ncbi:selenophosphate synthase [Palleronia aestuarii]|uniref:Selenophosphate synthase n=1 Tax=Palleronia aestuarii TaxID=568105 RepID=A0A2W7NYR6_9RHOB|nr:selenide, water dikinase SelD [Palleronia aestuarii]PZX16332.1 selenophosphate synthase [Palleronia aestuarii]
MRDPLPLSRDLVLVGGGHAHALVLKSWGMKPLPGVRLTLVNPGPTAPYTGMLPGFVAGHYTRDDLEIDLVRLARFAGARIVLGRAVGLDRAAGEIAIEDDILGMRHIGYDVASLDIGIHSEMPDLPGFAEHAVPAKPLARFAERWAARREAGETGPMAVIGGGVGGVELALAMAFATGGRVTLIDGGRILSGVGPAARTELLRALDRHGVERVEGAEVVAITGDGVTLADGREIAATFVTGAAGARPHDWLRKTGLDLHEGFVRIDRHLRSIGDPAIFAAGDCAHMDFAPRPKAGVFAVRQAPVLAENLRAALSGGRLRSYRPQRDYLKLVATGEKSAVADKWGLRLSGPWLWRWKDRVDAKFMAKLRDLEPMAPPPLPRRHAEGLATLTAQTPCGGCAAKVGRATLGAALAALPGAARDDVELGAGDDAAILRIGGARQVLTVDQLTGVTEDPALLARIAAHHAMGDCLAMGAVPQAALSLLTLPRASPRIEARMLAEISAAAGAVFVDAGAAVVGGHSATGPALAIGYTVTGLLEAEPRALGAARAGDVLLLTRPLGTGILLAAEMALAARGPDVAAAWRQMAAPQAPLLKALAPAHAITDVTGFGLAGHLMGLLDASVLAADLDLGALPLLDGVAALLDRGVRSSLHASNRAALDRMRMPEDTRSEILFDPQTAGGLLACLPEGEAEAVLRALRAAGGRAWRIGRLTEGPPEIRVA